MRNLKLLKAQSKASLSLIPDERAKIGLNNYIAALEEIAETAYLWRKGWVDVEDKLEEQEGCKCEICQLIRKLDELK